MRGGLFMRFFSAKAGGKINKQKTANLIGLRYSARNPDYVLMYIVSI